jgi:hypothetical protein
MGIDELQMDSNITMYLTGKNHFTVRTHLICRFINYHKVRHAITGNQDLDP